MTNDVTARHISAARRILGWTQEQLATRAGCSAATIRSIETYGLTGQARIFRRVVGALESEGIMFRPRSISFPEQLGAA